MESHVEISLYFYRHTFIFLTHISFYAVAIFRVSNNPIKILQGKQSGKEIRRETDQNDVAYGVKIYVQNQPPS